MKTTLNLNDLLLTRAKRHAARSGVTLTRFVEDALRARLAEDDRPKLAFELELVTDFRRFEHPQVRLLGEPESA